MTSSYTRKCWTNTVGSLYQSLLWAARPEYERELWKTSRWFICIYLSYHWWAACCLKKLFAAINIHLFIYLFIYYLWGHRQLSPSVRQRWLTWPGRSSPACYCSLVIQHTVMCQVVFIVFYQVWTCLGFTRSSCCISVDFATAAPQNGVSRRIYDKNKSTKKSDVFLSFSE